MPVSIPRLEEATVDIRALGLGLAVIVGTTMFFGLVPALVLLRSQLVKDLRTGERGSSRGARTIYSVLVAGEVALACALLVASGLLVRTVGGMMDTPTGIDANEVVVSQRAAVGPRLRRLAQGRPRAWRHHRQHPAAARRDRRRRQQLHAVRGRLARCRSASRANRRRRGQEDAPQVQYHSVSDGYFESMGATMAAGRGVHGRR